MSDATQTIFTISVKKFTLHDVLYMTTFNMAGTKKHNHALLQYYETTNISHQLEN